MFCPAPQTPPPSASCKDLFRAFSPVKGRSPPEAARFQRALDRAEGSENKARQEIDGFGLCRQDDEGPERRTHLIGDLISCHRNSVPRVDRRDEFRGARLIGEGPRAIEMTYPAMTLPDECFHQP